MTARPFFSVVVPFLNVEEHLNGCIRSLQGQSFGDFEAIFIDDGSTDASMDVYEGCAQGDRRFKLIRHEENRGEANSRNEGIDVARGEYLLLFDSDDYFSPNTLQRIYDEIVDRGSDIVVFGGDTFPEESWAAEDMRVPDGEYQDSLYALFEGKGCRPFAANKAYRLEMVKTHSCGFDPVLRVGLDHAFQFITFPYAKKVSSISETLYHYRQWSGSVMGNVKGDAGRRLTDHVRFVSSIIAQWDQRGFLKDQESMRLLANWVVGYLFGDLIRNGGSILKRCFEEILGWFQDGPLDSSVLAAGTAEAYDCMVDYTAQTSMSDNAPLVTVLLPLYDASARLADVLFMLRAQTLTNFRALMVWRGSESEAPAAARKYCALDDRFELIVHGGHEGDHLMTELVNAAEGRFLMLCEPNDAYAATMLARSVSVIERTDADVCLFESMGYDMAQDASFEMRRALDLALTPVGSYVPQTDLEADLFCFAAGFPWSKLYRTSFVQENGLSVRYFGLLGAPSFTLLALALAKRIVILDESLMTHVVDGSGELLRVQHDELIGFYDDLVALRNELFARGILPKHDRSFSDMALESCLMGLDVVATCEGHQLAYEHLQSVGLDRLGLIGRRWSDICHFDPSNHDRLLFIQKRSSRAYRERYPKRTWAHFLSEGGRSRRESLSLPQRLRGWLHRLYFRLSLF